MSTDHRDSSRWTRTRSRTGNALITKAEDLGGVGEVYAVTFFRERGYRSGRGVIGQPR